MTLHVLRSLSLWKHWKNLLWSAVSSHVNCQCAHQGTRYLARLHVHYPEFLPFVLYFGLGEAYASASASASGHHYGKGFHGIQ